MIVQKILVVGAGLAGLSAAIALARRGVQVTIATLDARAEGASITITNRAVDAVEALGVLDACLAAGLTPSNGKSLFRRSGTTRAIRCQCRRRRFPPRGSRPISRSTVQTSAAF